MNIKYLFDQLMIGNASVLTVENIQFLNNEALNIYNIPELNKDQIEELKQIIMICNVLYNRTDMTVLPIEDGFYDLLLEKYKKYDPHFQVGSAVVEFRDFIENDLDNPRKIAECPIVFYDNPERDETHQYVRDHIMIKGQWFVDRRDFYQCPVTFDNQYIGKRTHNTKHNHPTLVGTLDKCKFVLNQDAIDAGVFDDPNVAILERDFFQDHIKKGIIRPDQELEIVVELKYDGISVEADCGMEVISARTRGDTGIGEASDITPILKGYQFKHAPGYMIGEEPVGVKFEAIITKSNLYKFNQLRGRKYANGRTAIIGLFGASDAYKFRDLITLVPLALDREQFYFPLDNRLQEIEILNQLFISHGEPLRYCYFKGTIPELLYYIKAFADEAKIARDQLDFMYDGIVVSYLDENIRAKLGRVNYINKYSVAVKFNPLEKQTIFRGYTYEIGQHGNITPMIHYDPVEFLGTIHTKSTGSSLKRFQDLQLKYGDFINVTYVNDVMPYVSRVECEHNRKNPNPIADVIDKCPVCGTQLVISDSGKSLLCPNPECPGRSIKRMTNMFDKLNIKGFAEATFKLLKCDHFANLFQYDRETLVEILGNADGNAFADVLQSLLNNPQQDYMIMGALGFTSIARKKWQSILQIITVKELFDMYLNCIKNDTLMEGALGLAVPSIANTVTAKTIANEFNFFAEDIDFILNHIKLINSKGQADSVKGQIRFTGFRNQQLKEQLCNAGYDADDSSVTKKTNILLIPYEGFSSSKVTKAQSIPGIKIIPINDFLANMGNYVEV